MGEKEIIEAGRIAKKVLSWSASEIRAGLSYLKFADEIEKRIIEEGGEIAFPVNISANNVAAHDTAHFGDKRIFVKGDVIKIDLGVHVDGFMSDTAITKEIGTNNHSKIIECTQKCVDTACDMIKPEITIGEIGSAIQNVLEEYQFSVVKNLVGHGLDRYVIHSGLNIQNYRSNNKTKIKDGMLIAIEPYATYGDGFAVNSSESEIFALNKLKPVRIFKARQIMEWIKKERNTLPFAKRWIVREFGKSSEVMVNLLVRDGVIRNYPVLKEISGKIVSQREHTVLVKESPIITTR